MIPSTTVTGFGFTGSGVQTTTGSTASSTASHSGSVTQHDMPPQLLRIESFSGQSFSEQSLQQRSVSSPLLFASLGNLASDASLKNLALDDRERVMKMIQEAQQNLDACSDAIKLIQSMHREASNMGIIATNKVPLGKLNPDLPTLNFTAWPRTLNPDLIIPSISSVHSLQEAIREICRQANIAVHNEAGLQDQKDAIISNILTSKKEIESLKNELDKLKNELGRLFHESTKDAGTIQSLEKTLEDTSRKLTVSQENARDVAEELQNLNSTLERKNIELNTSESKASEAESSIQQLKKQNASTKRQLKLSQSEEAKAKAKIRKLDETYKKRSGVIQSLSNELKIMTENEHAKQKKLIESLQKNVNLHEQLINETDDLKSKLLASEEKFQKFKTDIASDIGCPEAINPVDLVEQVSVLGKKLYSSEEEFSSLLAKYSALEKKLYSSEVEFSSLSAEYQVIRDSERKLYAENLKKEEELKNLRHLLKEEQVQKLTNKNKLLNGEVAARQKENVKLKNENERAKRQLEESKKKEITAKVDIQKLQQELRDQKKSFEEKFESIAKFKTYIASAIGCPAASANRYQEAISFEDLIKKVSALKKELHSSEVKFSSLSAEYQVVKDSERNLHAENLKKEEELKNLRHLLKDAEEPLRRNQQSLKDRVSAVNVDHGCTKRQEPCTKIPQSVTTNETEREAVDTLLLLSGQSSSDATPELRGLLQKKETAG
ncbi:hypothetical protein NX722_24390 [Endozoicomonas gorgoniicola]|uniref:Chromosome partition protein Smc n=1 Tax=Endozoicomonas gorgoniicola TaxID=1234144 RepID=A0ABT3N253_9GAMM|nr:hypothetical protein [Endozoicomonas gorgoniicola]MCW7555709.1 hypothetical protein [Endozoicomonas gorgoniicola]